MELYIFLLHQYIQLDIFYKLFNLKFINNMKDKEYAK